jgi:hypothetical protein
MHALLTEMLSKSFRLDLAKRAFGRFHVFLSIRDFLHFAIDSRSARLTQAQSPLPEVIRGNAIPQFSARREGEGAREIAVAVAVTATGSARWTRRSLLYSGAPRCSTSTCPIVR